MAEYPQTDCRGSEAHRGREGISCRPASNRLTLARTTYRTCAGGKYDPAPSPRYAEPAPRYNTGGMNRVDGPEDAGLGVRCLPGRLPEFSSISFRRIVANTGGHLDHLRRGPGPRVPAQPSSWTGARICRPTSVSGLAIQRGHWEGKPLVIDVTNFSPKMTFAGSRENLHVGRTLDADQPRLKLLMRSRSKIRPCGCGHGPSSASSPAERAGK